MLRNILEELENPKRPYLGPNVKALQFWGLLLPDNFWKKCFYLLMQSLVCLFIVTEYIDVWFIKFDINLLLNNLKINFLATVTLAKALTFLLWQKYWKSIIEYVTEADLYQRTISDENKIQIIKAVTKYSRKITYLYWILMYTTVIALMGHPMYKYFSSPTYRDNVKNGTESYMPVLSSWVPFNNNKMPGYLAASAFQSYAAIYGGGWVTSFDSNAVAMMIFFKTELQMIRKHCAEIFGSEISPIDDAEVMRRLKDCHRRHVDLIKYARLFNSCLLPVMLFYLLVCSTMLCVSGYQITMEPNPMERFLTTQYLIFGVAQLFMFCWHSNDVLLASQAAMMGPYESVWWSKGVKHRRDLFILTAQIRKEVVFTAGPFMDLTLATFINILKGAYSYYTLLTNSQKK